ncbi:MAG TPA: hypothetical protein VE641_16115 [Chthoniobacterales bacterium]|nr:hypothetical protein [Chthoniobacterales bacterium]
MTETSPSLKPASSLTTSVRRASQLRQIIENSLGLVIVLVLLIAFFSFQTIHFFSTTTFEAIANEIPTGIFIAIGMTFVLIIGGIDLSVGSVLALGAGLLGIAIVQWHWPLWAAVALCVLSGTSLRAVEWLSNHPLSLAFLYRNAGSDGSGSRRHLSGHKFPDHVYRLHHRSGR